MPGILLDTTEQNIGSRDTVLGELGFLNAAHFSKTVYLMISGIYLSSPEITLWGCAPGLQVCLSM